MYVTSFRLEFALFVKYTALKCSTDLGYRILCLIILQWCMWIYFLKQKTKTSSFTFTTLVYLSLSPSHPPSLPPSHPLYKIPALILTLTARALGGGSTRKTARPRLVPTTRRIVSVLLYYCKQKHPDKFS